MGMVLLQEEEGEEMYCKFVYGGKSQTKSPKLIFMI